MISGIQRQLGLVLYTNLTSYIHVASAHALAQRATLRAVPSRPSQRACTSCIYLFLVVWHNYVMSYYIIFTLECTLFLHGSVAMFHGWSSTVLLYYTVLCCAAWWLGYRQPSFRYINNRNIRTVGRYSLSRCGGEGWY